MAEMQQALYTKRRKSTKKSTADQRKAKSATPEKSVSQLKKDLKSNAKDVGKKKTADKKDLKPTD